jgi:hypothetical protein
LSVESFDLNNATIFPEQSMSNLGNPSVSFFTLWFYGSQEKFDAADKTKLTTVKQVLTMLI